MARLAAAVAFVLWLILAPAAALAQPEQERPPAPGQGAPPGVLYPLGKEPQPDGKSEEEEQPQKRFQPYEDRDAPGEARPVRSGLPEVIPPFPALQIFAGSPQLFVRTTETDPAASFHPGHAFAHGAFWGFDWVGRYLRGGYYRLLYRHDLPEDTEVAGRRTRFLNFESDSLWGHAGLRPWEPVYAGLGLGLQQRRVSYDVVGRRKDRVLIETVPGAGLLLEYAIGQPFVLQMRYVHDLPGASLDLTGVLVLFAYTIPM